MARIVEIVELSPSIKRIALQAADGAALTAAAAGAHIILTIPGPARAWKNAYSLVSAPGMRARYEVVVRRVENSRGGSAWLHDHAVVSQEMEMSGPANLFPIARTARRHLLISGGVGLTPFLAYLPALQVQGAEFEWHHCGRAEDEAAFRALLPERKNVTLHNNRNTLNLPALLAAQRLHTHLYVCGPAGFMDVVVVAAQKLGWPTTKIHQESFGGATGGAPFTVRLARSGLVLHVKADESLLEVLENAGLTAPCLCRGGACGMCEVPVLDGVPEHRDHVLDAARRADNKVILTCVSRAKTPELVLDF